jgi:hypothetical protein
MTILSKLFLFPCCSRPEKKKRGERNWALSEARPTIGTHHGKNQYLSFISGWVSVSFALWGGRGTTYGIKTIFFENLSLLIEKCIA